MPPEYIDYLLCKKFGWTITELNESPRDRILEFLTIIRIEGRFEDIEQQRLNNESPENMEG